MHALVEQMIEATPKVGLVNEFGRAFYDITPGDLHIYRPLTNILITYRPHGFIADNIAPTVTVEKQSDVIPMMSSATQRRKPDKTKRAPATRPAVVHFDVTSLTYHAQNYALMTYLTREEAKNADPAWNTSKSRAELIWDLLMIDKEYRVHGLCTDTTNGVGGNTTTASGWQAFGGGGDPLQDVENDIEACEYQAGFRPNQITFGKWAWRCFRMHEKVRGLFRPHGGGIPNQGEVADALGVDKINVGGTMYNSAAEGATESLTRLWHDEVHYCYNPPNPSKERPAYMYDFRWVVPGMPNQVVRRFLYDDKIGAQEIHVGYYSQEKVIDKNLAYLRLGVGSSQ
jgi:hypothetical protein